MRRTVEQREPDYPPGTVGYLAQGRGWGKKPQPEQTEEESQEEGGVSSAPADTADEASDRAVTQDGDDAPQRDAVTSRTDEDADGGAGAVGGPDDESDLATPEVDGPPSVDTAVPGDTAVGPPAPERARRSRVRWVEPGALAAQQAQRARTGELGLGEGDDLDATRVSRRDRRVPRSGWRRLIYMLTNGLINFGESPADLRRRLLTARVNQPLHGCYKIAMLSLKGGVGKTTVTAT
ncbi:MAG: hypothetical protein J2P19_31240, partial [Pseudonocardia sp.]|nr:hypothetical protein [Pseudonocardia sp.]